MPDLILTLSVWPDTHHSNFCVPQLPFTENRKDDPCLPHKEVVKMTGSDSGREKCKEPSLRTVALHEGQSQ